MPQLAAMGAVAALIVLAEAAMTCSPTGAGRLRAGASVVKAIVTVERERFEASQATPAALRNPAQPRATRAAGEPEPEPPAGQCKRVPLPIA